MAYYKTAAPDRYEILKDFARKNRINPTPAELVLWQHLRDNALGVKFLRQHIIGDYIVDFFSRKEGLVIEVDGAYHAEQCQQEEDALREEWLESMGFHILRFTNEEILNDIDNVLQQITDYFEQ